ncbi:ECF transporter S component [Clostridium manihotivorum]|uniref:ECF transporter S component n=1 Tax=Clostridium manihotivorum TaxID=2320868 RepID=A0A3R5WZD9_9CLOT|nr:ECF transporter S component [Clostridium manihotivorum]QAA30337.1 hypothetical protein C1I91_00805 [Clostridium manihotivorum]
MKTKNVVYIGLLAALCFVATYINIPLNLGGAKTMIHLGTTAIFISAVMIGPEAGFAGAIGCGLFDLLDPAYASYAIFTFIIKGLQGYSAGKIAFLGSKKGESPIQNLFAFLVGAIVSLIGYFFVDWLVFYNLPVALQHTLTSIATSVIGIIFSLVVTSIIKPITKKANIGL